jgi:hypothetical protein
LKTAREKHHTQKASFYNTIAWQNYLIKKSKTAREKEPLFIAPKGCFNYGDKPTWDLVTRPDGIWC